MLPSLRSPRSAPVSACPLPARGAFLPAAVLALAAVLAGCGTDAGLQMPAPAPVVATPAPAPTPAPPVADDKEPEDAAPAASADTPAAAAPRPSLVKHLLVYSDQVAALAPPALAAEIARLTPRQEESAQQQLELALALGQTRLPADTARALGLVQRALAQKDNAPLVQSFARLLENRYLQQRRLEDQIDRQNNQVRDAQRRNDQLNERLEAMRAIERSLNARPGGPANGKSVVPPAP